MDARTVRPWVPVLASSAWMASVLNAPLWRELGELGLLARPSGWVLAFALGAVVFAVVAALLSLLAGRRLLKPAIAALLAVAAAGAYFMLSYHVVIDAGMIDNVLQTDAREAAALFDPRLPLALAVFALLPAAAILRLRVAYAAWPRQLLRNAGAAALCLLAAALVVVASFQPLASAMRNHKQLRYLLNPLNSVYAVGQAAYRPLRRDHRLEPVGLDARVAAPADGKPPLLVLVLGETARAGHFGLNGYERDTTPLLAREDVASWRNAWACGTSTAASVPCMFSHLGRSGFEGREHDYENLLDVLQRAGLAVLWLDNQSGCKGVCDRVAHASTAQQQHPAHCADGECLDGILLEGLSERLDALPAPRRARGVVVVLHQMGGHGPAYWRRSPEAGKRFQPECRSVNLQDCDREALLNAYDNAIAYTDAFLAATVAWLKTQEPRYAPAMLYVADHGESLGENNLYLHGLPYAIAPDVQKRVPWITWTSPAFARRTGITAGCLRAQAERPVSHDHYFHGVLGLLQVETALYRRELDPYAPCEAAAH